MLAQIPASTRGLVADRLATLGEHDRPDPRALARRPGLRADAPRQPLARGRHGRGEGHPASSQGGAEQLFSAELECFVDLGPHQKGAHMSRFEEIVNDAIGEVVLGEATFKAETARACTSPSSCATARTRCAPRSRSRARYPEYKPAPVSGHPDAGDLHAVRLGRRLRGGHAPAHRRRGAGHDRVPVRAGARRRAARASASSPTASTTTQIERILEPVPVATHNQRGLGTLHDRLPGGLRRPTSTRATLLAIVEELDVVGDLRAHEALRRGRGRREGPPPPAVRRGLRARDRSAACSRSFPDLDRPPLRLRPPGEPRDDPPAQRRRRALRPARRAAPRGRRPASTSRTTSACGSGSTGRRAREPAREPGPEPPRTARPA